MDPGLLDLRTTHQTFITFLVAEPYTVLLTCWCNNQSQFTSLQLTFLLSQNYLIPTPPLRFYFSCPQSTQLEAWEQWSCLTSYINCGASWIDWTGCVPFLFSDGLSDLSFCQARILHSVCGKVNQTLEEAQGRDRQISIDKWTAG